MYLTEFSTKASSSTPGSVCHWSE